MTEPATVAIDGNLDRATTQGLWATLRGRIQFWVSVVLLAILTLIAAVPGVISGFFGESDPRACDLLDSNRPPGPGHPFGTDVQGCDVLANVLFGTRTSLFIGLATTAMCLVIAIALGTLAGYLGRWVDAVIARSADIVLGFPFLLGAIIVLNTAPDRSPLLLSAVLAFFSWPTFARLIRSSVKEVREREFVQAAHAMGFSQIRVVLSHVLPNSLAPTLAIAATMVGGVIGAEATLTFLGVGLVPPTISWGVQLSTAQSYFQLAPNTVVFPSIFLTITVISLIMLGDALRDALDPRGRS
ncbi:ABC transporter permease [Microbacterium murale]|uniref:Oligopeptide transport system permease protein n=1 Tax=Microbacterium murale TaxID=1081040 RepID=A0ABU0P5W3_9MICO|nr:ABC transporter permease [Microbacterium murale]MDQ0642721.1 oligopeptide transport system permease protein [Microbacterium murale]